MIFVYNEKALRILAGALNVEREGIMYVSIPSKEKIFVAYTVLSGKDDKTIDIKNVRIKLRDSNVVIEVTLKDNTEVTIKY